MDELIKSFFFQLTLKSVPSVLFQLSPPCPLKAPIPGAMSLLSLDQNSPADLCALLLLRCGG